MDRLHHCLIQPKIEMTLPQKFVYCFLNPFAKMNLPFLLFALFVAFQTAEKSLAENSPSGDKIVEFCKSHLNQQVGSGECAALAGLALKSAGAKIHAGPDFPNPKDYVWGKQIYLLEGSPDGTKETGSLSDVNPGDILQYRDTKFGEAGGFMHHTAVVAEVYPEKGKIKIYQQNVGGKRFVTEGHPNLKHLVAGWIRFYRPVMDTGSPPKAGSQNRQQNLNEGH